MRIVAFVAIMLLLSLAAVSAAAADPSDQKTVVSAPCDGPVTIEAGPSGDYWLNEKWRLFARRWLVPLQGKKSRLEEAVTAVRLRQSRCWPSRTRHMREAGVEESTDILGRTKAEEGVEAALARLDLGTFYVFIKRGGGWSVVPLFDVFGYRAPGHFNAPGSGVYAQTVELKSARLAETTLPSGSSLLVLEFEVAVWKAKGESEAAMPDPVRPRARVENRFREALVVELADEFVAPRLQMVLSHRAAECQHCAREELEFRPLFPTAEASGVHFRQPAYVSRSGAKQGWNGRPEREIDLRRENSVRRKWAEGTRGFGDVELEVEH